MTQEKKTLAQPKIVRLFSFGSSFKYSFDVLNSVTAMGSGKI